LSNQEVMTGQTRQAAVTSCRRIGDARFARAWAGFARCIQSGSPDATEYRIDHDAGNR
jgi:hypothetical protein